jgi:hypothetical protein
LFTYRGVYRWWGEGGVGSGEGIKKAKNVKNAIK